MPGEPVLKGASLKAEPGQTVAIVGPTCAGKTTIINLIPRFYDVTGGSVLIDGNDVRAVTSSSLRSQIGIVIQDSFLLSDTVMENMRFGRPDATDEKVIAHRLSTIRNADQVLVIDQGEFVERGTHQSLMKARGFYYDLYMSQFRRQEPEAEAGSDGRQPGLKVVPAPARD